MSDLLTRAQAWLEADPDPDTRSELKQLIEAATFGEDLAQKANALRDLGDRFAGPLEFGTAGLRGVIGAGETRMNRAVIRRTTAGLARYLLDQDAASAQRYGVVIGYDGRRMSREFAEDTARVLAALGVPAHLSPIACPTPVTAFAVEALSAVAGVMVTASHNPPEYNGYKVYWRNAAQIIPPHDKGIAAAIDAQPVAKDVPLMDIDQAREQGLLHLFPSDLEKKYINAVLALSVRSDGNRSLPIVYTPLHGVGNRLVRIVLDAAGFSNVTTVPEQAEPDGAFPTVAFPNPEEKGAMDLSFALAKKQNAALVVANDPDVDRLAVAVRNADGGYTQLTGNQVGTLLGHYLLTKDAACLAKSCPIENAEKKLVIASIVSSPMLGTIARANGVRYEETLTGFKWIANRAMDLGQKEGLEFVFGYEEALGYTVGTLVRDKDGIGAALLLCELAALLDASQKTLFDELAALSRRYGFFASGQRSVTRPGTQGLLEIQAGMDRLRAARPENVGPLRVLSLSDFQAQVKTLPDDKTEALSLPKSNMIALDLEGGSRIIARPSGTEPKIKFYFDIREPIAEGEAIDLAEARANQRMEELKTAFSAIVGM